MSAIGDDQLVEPADRDDPTNPDAITPEAAAVEVPLDQILGAPSAVTNAPIDAQLATLPTNLMEWRDFEKLLLRVAHEIRGLRSVVMYGRQGQTQDGLDVVGINAATEPEGVQAKKYAKFGKADLELAVSKYTSGTRPIEVTYLAIGVASPVEDTEVAKRLIELNVDHQPVEIEIWDQGHLSTLLRKRPDIVREFFGPGTAERFCGGHAEAPVPVPGSGSIATAEAIALGPEQAGEAGSELALADAVDADDPEQALRHVRRAQDFLTEAKFHAHASVLDERVAALLTRLGRTDEASRLLLDRFWDRLAEEQGHELGQICEALSGLPQGEPTESGGAAELPAVAITRAALSMVRNPLGELPGLTTLLGITDDELQQARLSLLAAEIATADGNEEWLTANRAALEEVAQHQFTDAELSVRLRLIAAEGTGDWTVLIGGARTRAHGRRLAALVLARHARYLATHGQPGDADQSWIEAVEQACLCDQNCDAAAWIYSRRQLKTRHASFFKDTFHPLAAALNARPSHPPIAAASAPVRERALEAIQRGDDRRALPLLRRHLRDAVVGGRWQDEYDARRLIAESYAKVGSTDLAARHLVLGGEAKRAHELGRSAGDTYIDVRRHLTAPSYWVRAAALRLIAAQADVIPDEHVREIGEFALGVVDAANRGELVDGPPMFDPSVYRAAIEALGSLAARLAPDQAKLLLEHLEPLVDVEPGHYRFTDDAHGDALSGIAAARAELRQPALVQLARLFLRSDHSVPRLGRDLLVRHYETIAHVMQPAADDGLLAAATIQALAVPAQMTAAAREEAALRLAAPTSNTQGVYSIGTGAGRDSVIAADLPPDRRARLVEHQLDSVASPHEPGPNRREYLLAAANLAIGLSTEDAERLFPRALAAATTPSISEADSVLAEFTHPLSAARVTVDGRSRGAAALLAARLAATRDQRAAARAAALSLIGRERDDVDVTRALQVLQDDLTEIVALLSTMSWSLRCLAAIAWAKDPSNGPIGERLATDPDARVRRTLAEALSAATPDARTDDVREQLAADPRHSVRSALAGPATSS